MTNCININLLEMEAINKPYKISKHNIFESKQAFYQIPTPLKHEQKLLYIKSISNEN